MRISEGMTQRQIAAITGIEQSGISRWKLGKNAPSADNVIKFARAYHRSPIEALIAAGYVDATEVNGIIEVGASVSDVPSDELLGELGRRLVHAADTAAPTDSPATGMAPNSGSHSGGPPAPEGPSRHEPHPAGPHAAPTMKYEPVMRSDR